MRKMSFKMICSNHVIDTQKYNDCRLPKVQTPRLKNSCSPVSVFHNAIGTHCLAANAFRMHFKRFVKSVGGEIDGT